MPDFRSMGLIVNSVDDIARGYSAAMRNCQVFDSSKCRDWRQLYVWFRHVASSSGYIRVAVSLTDSVNPYLHHIKERYSTHLVGVQFGEWSLHYDYDALYEPWEVGWGIDRSQYLSVMENRRPKTKPAFHMLSSDAAIEQRLRELGYDVHSGDNFYLGDVAIEPNGVVVPTKMYEAASSGMPVVSIKENEGWTKPLGVYENLFLDDSVDRVVSDVVGSDFLYAGMIARDMVPGLRDFRQRMWSILNGFGK